MRDRATLPDQEARRRIEEDLGTCFLVEAGAGSGKTHSLVARMVSLIASGRARTGGIAAITFTRKAAAELRERFQIRLEQAAASEPDPARRARLQEGVATLDRAFLGTIHAFCARILRERPVEAGLDPAFQEMDEEEEGRWARAAWEAYLERVRVEEPQRIEALRALGVEPRELYGLFQALHAHPDVEPVVADVPRPDLEAVRRELEGYLQRAAASLPRSEPPGGWDGLQKKIRRIALQARYLRPGDDGALIRLLEAFEAHPAKTLNRWDDPETAREAEAAFEAFRDGIARPALRAWREHVHRPVVEFVRPAVDLAARMREEAGKASFQDLLLRAARLLREDPQVRRSLASRYTHLLVDEFQDTDPVQAEVVLLLTGEPLEEADWRRLAPRPGSLFVVGDPKQSIYRFRRADIDVYRQVKEQLVRGGGEVLQLSANFRSVEPLIGWVNRVFGERFPAEDDGYQAAYVPLAPVRAADPGAGAAVWVAPVPRVARHREDAIIRADASRVAAWIAWACGGGLRLRRTPEEEARGVTAEARPGDFLVLHRDRKSLLVYAQALEALGIPAEVTGAKGYARAPEVVAFLDLLGLLADPAHPVKLLAVLRGPLFGLTDRELYDLGRELDGRWERCLEVAVDGLPEPGRTALRTLQTWFGWTRSLPAQAALEAILDATGLLPWTAAGPAGAALAGNLVKLVEVARAAGSGLSFPRLVETLREVVESRELEAGSLFPGRLQAVRVMNLHRAKGLEAPVVVLAHPVGSRAHPPAFHIRREGGGARGYFPARVPGASGNGWGSARTVAVPPGWEAAAAEEARYQEAEEMRLLYVAATRARELLVVSRYLGKPEASPWHPLEEGGALNGAPVLPEPAGPPHEPEQVPVDPAAVDAARRRTEEALDGSRRATFLHLAAGELARGGGPSGGSHTRPDERGAAAAAREARRAGAGPDAGRAVPEAPGAGAAPGTEPPPPELGDPDDGGAFWLPDEEGALEPGGAAWGRATHRLLEFLAREARRGPGSLEAGTIGELARFVAREEGLPPEEGEDPAHRLRLWAERFLRSELWARVGRARRVEVEVPLALALSAGELGGMGLQEGPDGAEEGTPVVVRGQADLLFQEEDGWVLVDYKTDRLPGPDPPTALAARYGPQLEAYASAWRRATGERVKERWLYLVRYGRALALP